MLWSNFDSLCNSGENVDPNIIWEKDPESLETLEYCTGANPVMNLINCSASAGQTTPAQGVLPTPVRQQTVSKVAGGRQGYPGHAPAPHPPGQCDCV